MSLKKNVLKYYIVPHLCVNFRLGIADTTVVIVTIYPNSEEVMEGIQEIDMVLHHVRRAMLRLRIVSDAAITQQILLLGDSFYGYRFTATDFTAVWSAADQILKVFDTSGKVLDAIPTAENTERTADELIPWSPQRRAA